jgi:methylenetetrahydrofolate reductase (NADPH)
MPAELDERLAAAGDDKERIEAVGIQWVYEQARELLERGAPGIHLYILNRQGPAVTLLEKLKAVGFYKV